MSGVRQYDVHLRRFQGFRRLSSLGTGVVLGLPSGDNARLSGSARHLSLWRDWGRPSSLPNPLSESRYSPVDNCWYDLSGAELRARLINRGVEVSDAFAMVQWRDERRGRKAI